MELALVTQKTKPNRALTVALRQFLFLVATAFGIAYLSAACISFACRPANSEPGSSTVSRGLEFHARVICEPTAVSAVAARTMPVKYEWGLAFTTRAAVCE